MSAVRICPECPSELTFADFDHPGGRAVAACPIHGEVRHFRVRLTTMSGIAHVWEERWPIEDTNKEYACAWLVDTEANRTNAIAAGWTLL